MKKDFSPAWISSRQPRKQRKYRYNATLHLRQKMVSAHLDKTLRKEYGRRAVPLRTGDEVVIVRGAHSKKKGKVMEVDLKRMKVTIDGVTVKKVTGQDIAVQVDPSNLVITKLKIDDKKRMKLVQRKAETKNIVKSDKK